MNHEVQSYKFNNLEITTNRQALMRRFAEIKSLSRLPVYLYLIQRL